MAKDKSIPDSIAPHLSQIAERLWSRRAAVMVGAGFSKNASRDYPSWAQLGDKLYEKAHAKTPSTDDKSYLSLLKVAEEAESVIGRPALDALLKSDIPDVGAKPSSLHVRLLELPWIDVLTTNYDTLLERACREVIKHRYSYIVNQSDLPYAQKPRIIKLHGSFPGHLPFIITEEDYRKYPQTHAPFVNTVRQALLENTLCLIGFSGDDPNFLHWIGWVRDQLGSEGTLPIYLISASSFSTAQQLLLAKRNIVVVDMSLCDGVAKNDHKAALTRLFEFLDNKDPSRLDWPKSSHESRNGLWGPTNQKISLIELKDVVGFWCDQRLTYPGWLVLPHENRANLFFYTSRWLSAEMDAEVGELRDGLDILYFGELVWRIEKCLLPIFDNVAHTCESMLKKYCPFEGDLGVGMVASICRTDKTNSSLAWGKIQDAWLAVAFALLRYYREEGKNEKWAELKRQLESRRSYFSDEQSEFFHYQEYLFNLFKLDLSSARESLRKWQPTSSQPLWKSIRCFAMAELGQFDEVQLQSEIEDALYETRIKYQTGKEANTVAGLSHEAYQMVACRWLDNLDRWDTVASSMEEELMCARFQEEWSREGNRFVTWKEDWGDLKGKKDWSGQKDWNGEKNADGRRSDWQELLRSVRSEIRSKKAKSFNQRWDELKSDRCDPWGELKLLSSSGSSYFGQDKDRLNAYSFFRLFEDVGFSFRVRNMIFEPKSVVANLQHLANDSPYWVRSIFFRLGDNSRVIDQLFNRESICKLTAVESDDLIATCLGALEFFHGALKRGELFGDDCMENRLASVLPDVISRLCCKCSLEIKDRILSFIADIYASEHKNKFLNIHKLVRGFITSLSKPEQHQFLTKILDVGFPRNLGPRNQMNYVSLTQWLTIGDRKSESKPNIYVADTTIDALLQGAINSGADQRQWSVTSLHKLFNLNILNDSQKQRFSNALWAKVDETGFPDDTDFYNFVFLAVPINKDFDIRSSFKNYIDSRSFPARGDNRSYTVTQGHIPLVDEIVGASQYDDKMWTHQEALELLNKISLWWNTDKKWLEHERHQSDQSESFFGDNKEFYKRLSQISAVVVAIGPSLNSRLAKKEKTKLFDLLGDMHSQEIGTLEARAACVHVLPELRETLIGFIADALLGNNKTIQIDAHKAIRCIALNRKLVDLWSESYHLLIQFIQWNRSASLAEGMGITRRILNENDEFFPDSFKAIIGKRLIQLVDDSDYEHGKLDINVREKINLRRVAVSLAKKIDEVYEHKDDVLNKAIDDWRKIGESADEFAEVRNAWVE